MSGLTLHSTTPALGSEPVWPRDLAVEKHFRHRGHGAEFEMEADWIRRCLPVGDGPVLDVGCGIGALFAVIGEHRVIGADYSAEGLELTRQRFPAVPLWCAAAERIPSADSAFSAITCQHVIEHLRDPSAALREWHRVLRPGGVLVVLTPNGAFCDPSVYEDPTHVRVFDRHSLGALVVAAGFDILDLRSLGLPWFRDYHRWPGTWRARRFVTRRARWLSAVPSWRWLGQTLCCAARRPTAGQQRARRSVEAGERG